MIPQLAIGIVILIGGMRLLAAGLEQSFGAGARRTFARINNNPALALLCSTTATGLLQSSSASTLLIIGMADGGQLAMSAAVTAIMGANIGTTVTAQITAWRPDGLGCWFVLAGVVAYVIPAGRRGVAKALSAFGLVLIGLGLIDQGLAPIAPDLAMRIESADVAQRPWAGVVFGFVVTTLLDSSSATIALLQRLVSESTMPLQTAVTVLMGANIGTTTATLAVAAALGARARQTALAHLLFNVIAVLLWWPWRDSLVALASATAYSPAKALANLHLIFNVGAAVVQLPFRRIHLFIGRMIFPDEK